MKTVIRHITIDCANPYGLAEFWSGVLEVPMDPDDEREDPEALVDVGQGPGLLFVRVPEGKSVKNRVHLDVQPARRREEEVERLLELGATLVDDRRHPDGSGWVVLADPEGNEFCVERSAVERV